MLTENLLAKDKNIFINIDIHKNQIDLQNCIGMEQFFEEILDQKKKFI